MTDDKEPGYGLLMPFVVCESQGGPYADEPFVAGYRIGHLDAQLQYERPPFWEGYVAPSDVPQIDLLAMRHGYNTVIEPDGDEWTHMRLTASEPPATGDDRG